MSDSMKVDAAAVPVVRDTERFKLLFTNGRPRIPAGKPLSVDGRTSSEIIAQRLATLSAAGSNASPCGEN